MKYRRLKTEELEKLEQRFVQFLVANAITADDWKLIKEKDPDKTLKLIDIFSETFFETMLKKVQYLKYREAKEIKVFQCGEKSIALIALVADEKTPVDFTKTMDMKEIMKHTEGLSLYQKVKEYRGNREQEIFRMMETGCQISDGNLYQVLEKLYKS